MNRLSKLSLLLALGACFGVAGCKSDEENPVTPDVLKKIDEGRGRADFKPDMSSQPPAAADPRAGAPTGGHTSPSGN